MPRLTAVLGHVNPVFFPIVTSVKALDAVEYMNGLRKPRGGLPAATSRSLINAMMLANVGEDAEVPPTRPVSPPLTISKFHPCVATYKRNLNIVPF